MQGHHQVLCLRLQSIWPSIRDPNFVPKPITARPSAGVINGTMHFGCGDAKAKKRQHNTARCLFNDFDCLPNALSRAGESPIYFSCPTHRLVRVFFECAHTAPPQPFPLNVERRQAFQFRAAAAHVQSHLLLPLTDVIWGSSVFPKDSSLTDIGGHGQWPLAIGDGHWPMANGQ